MTLAAIADIVDAEGAVEFDRLCEKYRLDPADSLGIADPFLAWQLRVGLTARRDLEAAAPPAEDDPRADIEKGLTDIRRAERAMGIRA